MTDQELEQRLLSYTDLLYRISVGLLKNPHDREDAVQITLETAWRKADRLREDSKLKPWLTRIMINTCYTLLRKKQREIPLDVKTKAEETISPDALALRDALQELPQAQRLPLILHYFEGFSVQETAKAMGIPRGTVLSRMQRGREKLRQLLSEDYHGR